MADTYFRFTRAIPELRAPGGALAVFLEDTPGEVVIIWKARVPHHRDFILGLFADGSLVPADGSAPDALPRRWGSGLRLMAGVPRRRA